jgi:hypothetical protein
MDGSIVQWNDAIGLGQVQGEQGTFAFERADCSPSLQSTLAGRAIGSANSVPVTFVVDPIRGRAVNISASGMDV